MNKERVTVTLDNDLLLSLDELIDGLKVRNRSHAVELLLRKALNQKKLRKAFILAGGKGTRLRPITYEIPKPMVPIKGRPILEHTIELLRKHEIRDLIISVGYLGEKIKEYFGNGSKFGVRITYVEEEVPRGTAGALRLAEPLLEETFLMILGDNLFNIDLEEMYSFHNKNNKKVTIALKSVNDPSPFGVAILKGNNIINFAEKPKNPSSNLVNTGVYIIDPSIISLIPSGKSMIEQDLFPKLAERKELIGYFFEGQWFPTDNTERYEKAIKEWKGV